MTNPNHKALLDLLLSQDRKLGLIYGALSRELASVLRKYRITSKSDVWFKNANVKKDVQLVLKRYQKILFKNMDVNIRMAWDLSNNQNDELVKKYTSGINVPKLESAKYFNRNNAALDAFINRGRKDFNLSERVWSLSNQTQEQIEHFIAEGLTKGRPAAKLSQDLRKYLKSPEKKFRRIRNKETGKLILSSPAKNYHPGRGVYRSSYKNALRLARNEINIAYRTADLERRNNLPFVVGVEVHLSNAHPIYDICDELQGEYPKNFKFVGWHTSCLCFQTNKLLPRKDFIKYLNGKAIDSKQYVSDIPERASTYLNTNAEKLKVLSSEPYFLRDNFKNVKDGFALKTGVHTNLQLHD